MIKRAIAINQGAIEEALSMVRPGVLVYDLWQSLRLTVERNGGIFGGSYLVNLASVSDELYKGTRLGENQFYAFDTSITTWSYTEGRRRHYWSDISRCATATKPSTDDVGLQLEAGRMSNALADSVRVNQTIPEANSALMKTLERWKDYKPSLLVHSLGLWVHEQPMFQVGNLEKGFWAYDPEEEANFKFRNSTPFQIEFVLDPVDKGLHYLSIEKYSPR